MAHVKIDEAKNNFNSDAKNDLDRVQTAVFAIKSNSLENIHQVEPQSSHSANNLERALEMPERPRSRQDIPRMDKIDNTLSIENKELKLKVYQDISFTTLEHANNTNSS